MQTGYKLGYFKLLHMGKDSPDSRDVQSYGQKPPTLEICVMPKDMDIQMVKQKPGQELYTVPAGCIVFHVQAGSEWPDITEAIKRMDEILKRRKVEDARALSNSDKFLLDEFDDDP